MNNSGIGNKIHPTAEIGPNVIIGNYNYIGKNVIISGFKDTMGTISIGDCNIINDGTKIVIGEGGCNIGDWNVFHNSMLILGSKPLKIGHNCWFGQNTILDSSGGLTINNGVRVGMYSQIWTHVASGELIEGCTLFGERPTIIENDVWLVGSCIVSSGVKLAEKSIYLIGSNVTKSTEPNKVYAGSPAKILNKLSFYREISLQEKLNMIKGWAKEFVSKEEDMLLIDEIDDKESFAIYDNKTKEKLIFALSRLSIIDDLTSFFDITSKKYIKRLTSLERNFYKTIYGHKARFIPFDKQNNML